MKKKSRLEKALGSLPAEASMSALASICGGPVASFLPVLTGTLANNRHKKRVESAIKEIEDRLLCIENFNSSLTDSQYNLINKLVISILSTPDDEKVEFLKKAVFETPLNDALSMHDATVLSRVFDSISIRELSFLIECHGKKIVFRNDPVEGYLNIDKHSQDGEYATGLINIGMLSRGGLEGLIGDDGSYQFTPLADKLLNLITN